LITNGERTASIAADFIPVFGKLKMSGEIVEGKDLVSGKHYSTGDQLFGLGTLGAGSLLGKIYKGIKTGMSPEVEEAAGKLSNGTVFAMNGAGGASGIEKLAKNITKKIVGKGEGASEGAGNPNSIYKSNPLENPKVGKDVIENPDAVYGYSLKPESKLNSFGVDWTNTDEVAYAQSERIRYHEHLQQKKAMLKDEITKLQNDGYSMEDIARMKVEQRNQDRINNYIKSDNYDGLEAMKQRNLEEYQRAEGPTTDQLYKKYGSWEEAIYSSVRSNPAMDVVTGLYDIYGGN